MFCLQTKVLVKKTNVKDQALQNCCNFASQLFLPREAALNGQFLESELGADSLDLKFELVAADKFGLMHIDVKIVAYGAVS